MAQLSSTNIISDTGGSSASAGIDVGVGAYAQYFTLGSYNSASNTQSITFVTAEYHNWGSITVDRSQTSFVKFWVNVPSPTGTNVAVNTESQTSGNPTYTQGVTGTYTYTYSGRINRVGMYVSAGTFGSGLSAVVNVYSGSMSIVSSSTADFNFIDATPNISKIIELPPITPETAGRLYFYKVTGELTRNSYLLTTDGTVFADYNQPGVVINNSRGCATVFHNGSNWYVANYYPSHVQNFLSTTGTSSFSTNKSGTALINNINIFTTDSSNERRSGDNRLELPILNGTPGICIVAYVGLIDARTGGNALVFTSLNGAGSERKIDGPTSTYNNTSNKPYIVANEGHKNTGAVFITDGNYWYIVGWFNGSNWATSTNIGLISGSSDVSNNLLSQDIGNQHAIDVIGTTTGGNKLFVLPQNSVSAIPYVFMVKARSNANSMNINTLPYSNPSGTTVIHKDTKNMYFNENQRNICLWFVREATVVSGSPPVTTIRYYPVISYTPGVGT